jgi:hypothetical protein
MSHTDMGLYLDSLKEGIKEDDMDYLEDDDDDAEEDPSVF